MAIFSRVCYECNKPYTAQRAHGKFCGDKCRSGFHNRASKRGREYYHFEMIKRYARDYMGVKGLGEKLAREVIDKLSEGFREQDVRSRGGRPSYFGFDDAMTELGRLPGCPDGR